MYDIHDIGICIKNLSVYWHTFNFLLQVDSKPLAQENASTGLALFIKETTFYKLDSCKKNQSNIDCEI